MYKPGGVLDFLNKNKGKRVEDPAISKLFKDEPDISQVFHFKRNITILPL